MSMTEPLVSILISVYNAGEYLRPSVESILSQTYSNLEIFIIDDGSTDDCIDSISDLNDPRMQIIRQSNSGKSTVLNRAIEQLSGEFYAIQDADDISYPRRIERQVRCLLENPELVAVFTGYDIILNGRRMAPKFAAKTIEECRADIERFRMPSHDPTVMFRVSKVGDIRYEPTLKIGQGWDYILRVGERYPMMVLGECLYSHRLHPDSTTRRNPTLRRKMIQKVLERARQRRGLEPAEFLQSDSASVAKWLDREQKTGLVAHFMESVLDLRGAGKTWTALKTAFFCWRLRPLDPYYYKPLAYFVAPLALIRYYCSIKYKTG